MQDGECLRVNNLPVCKYGCSANKITARDEIASKVINESGKAALQQALQSRRGRDAD